MTQEQRGLTQNDVDTLSHWDNRAYSCACDSDFCQQVPCDNDRDDLYITVERLISEAVARELDALEKAEADRDRWKNLANAGRHRAARTENATAERDRLRALLDEDGGA